jgi:rhodanese-related sulfurtransferase
MTEISPRELHARREVDPLVIVDVREPWEYSHCHIDGSTLIPLETLPAQQARLARDAVTVLVCHHGMRSHYAAEYLRSCGFAQVLNLTGGIHRWATDVDPLMPQY